MTTSTYLFEKLNRPHLSVDFDFEIVSREAVDEVPLFVEDHNISLDKLSKDTNDVIRLLLRRLSEHTCVPNEKTPPQKGRDVPVQVAICGHSLRKNG